MRIWWHWWPFCWCWQEWYLLASAEPRPRNTTGTVPKFKRVRKIRRHSEPGILRRYCCYSDRIGIPCSSCNFFIISWVPHSKASLRMTCASFGEGTTSSPECIHDFRYSPFSRSFAKLTRRAQYCIATRCLQQCPWLKTIPWWKCINFASWNEARTIVRLTAN